MTTVNEKQERHANQSKPGQKQQAAHMPGEPEETKLLKRKLRNQASGSETGTIARDSTNRTSGGNVGNR